MTAAMSELPRILMFVCSGNTCRSPMAEGFANFFLEQKGMGSFWRACSSGVLAPRGLPASELAVRVMSGYGVDISRHRSSPVADWEPPEQTLFLGMTNWHMEELMRMLPGRSSRIFLLGEAAGFEGAKFPAEVSDPFGLSIASYRKIAEQIHDMTLSLLSSLDNDPRFRL